MLSNFSPMRTDELQVFNAFVNSVAGVSISNICLLGVGKRFFYYCATINICIIVSDLDLILFIMLSTF